jgi:hypothetical protein
MGLLCLISVWCNVTPSLYKSNVSQSMHSFCLSWSCTYLKEAILRNLLNFDLKSYQTLLNRQSIFFWVKCHCSMYLFFNSIRIMFSALRNKSCKDLFRDFVHVHLPLSAYLHDNHIIFWIQSVWTKTLGTNMISTNQTLCSKMIVIQELNCIICFQKE